VLSLSVGELRGIIIMLVCFACQCSVMSWLYIWSIVFDTSFLNIYSTFNNVQFASNCKSHLTIVMDGTTAETCDY
jgi:hypothetical protein